MSSCPSCGAALLAGAAECARCGVVLAKWASRHSGVAGTVPARRPTPLPRPNATTARSPPAPRGHQPSGGQTGITRLVFVLVLGLSGGGLLSAGYYDVKVRPRLERLAADEWPPPATEPSLSDLTAMASGWQSQEPAPAPDPVADPASPWGGGDTSQPPSSDGSPSADELLMRLRAEPHSWHDVLGQLKAAGREREAVPVLRDMLWDDDSLRRFPAALALREMGEKVSRARETDRSPELGPEDTDLVDLRVELDGGSLRASWNVHVGEAIFDGMRPTSGEEVFAMPTFAKYTVEVTGDTLAAPVELVYEATPGENLRDGEELASGLGPGKYHVSVFIHVQYVDAEGANRILNDSAGFVEVEG